MRKLILLFLICSIQFLFAQFPKHEFRGIWISTVNNLDWPSNSNLTPDQQREEFLAILDTVEAYHLNAVFVQIRAAGDAFYPSSMEPWSTWLTGKQGQAPTPFYDPLTFMIEECHKRNMDYSLRKF